MAITLYHHPFTRAATSLWMLEEVGVPYSIHYIDIMKGGHKAPEMIALNPMGKLPIIVDDDVVVTESAAIGLYLADRYALGRLAPLPDDPTRGSYLRWSLFAPSVVEPGSLAKAAGWDYKPGQAGWGTHDAMLDAMESALRKGDFILGDRFSMADVIFGGTLRFMLRFGMIEARPTFTEYAERIGARPACLAAESKNGAIASEHGLKTS